MSSVRRGAAVAQRYLVSLYFVGVVVQFFLVGIGLFGMKAGDTIGEAHSLNAHRDFGWALTEIGGGLVLIATLIAWQRPLLRRVGLYVVLCLLGFPVQGVLASSGEHHKVVGMFHPVNAILLLGLSGSLAFTAWKAARADEVRPETAVVGSAS